MEFKYVESLDVAVYFVKISLQSEMFVNLSQMTFLKLISKKNTATIDFFNKNILRSIQFLKKKHTVRP